MNFSISRETLLEPLQLVIGVVERRQTLPILANVLLSLEGDTLSLTATDLEIELIGFAKLSEPVPAPAQITVSGRKLLDICRSLPFEAEIHWQQDKERVILRSGRSRFILATLPADNFPFFEETEVQLELDINAAHLEQLLQRVHFSMAQQDVRYYLNGMLMQVSADHIRTAATDGHRFATWLCPISNQNKDTTQVIVPRKGVTELLRLLKTDSDRVQIILGQTFIRIKSAQFIFTSKLIDGRFPDYTRLLPHDPGVTVVLSRELLREALNRVSVLSNEKFRVIKVQIHANSLQMVANNPDQEEAEEVLTIEYSGSDIEVAFNVFYLLDALNAITSEQVRLLFAEPNHRLFISEEFASSDTDQQGVFLVMPLQL